MKSVVLNVNGMSCSHCENAIKKAVGALDGVDKVSVDLQAKTVAVDYNEPNTNLDEIRNTIEDQGYDVF
ncbi:MAG: hypothetical protein K0S47_1811 [Herbinix sp.]|jgi:copper chaperone|nr:hypothetical protein [Herbinix sp.]